MTNVPHTPLQARLSLGYSEDRGTTRLVDRDHYGPLLVQKPLYPEGREVCHTVIIHPPGGVVGGDELEITANVGKAAQVQITTPGAAKWYKANGHVSHQNIRLNVGAGGSLEWVPQETIFFDNADLVLDHQVRLEKDANYIGCEILCFGRTASGESFNGGRIRQRTRIYRDGKLIWLEQIRLLGGSGAMRGPLALAGRTVCGTLILTGRAIPRELIESAREGAESIAGDASRVGVSQLKSAVVVRYLGDSSETARRVMLHIWGLFRPAMLGRAAIVPRMWNT
ncbi:urease accessory protein UreD [Nitrosospira sp. Nsp2]|uniref:urease accessory protein UreD n=1 Tax=Nitrosospira sp. Nsp2 TaxID=136548 RepID=UPI002158DC9A|nr:urease accessory protein UreD [Nitrosospira sp. Nsp2]